MSKCPDCGFDHCHTRDFLATSAYCPRCSSSFPLANTFVDGLITGRQLPTFTVTDDQNMFGLPEGSTVTFTPRLGGQL